ncbi:PREDICTED: F-box protein At5g07610-like [Ipomoea nil]|uniref:F-box protein At5g07610-like n=1 Tax=Ipomoea nil TaxID=35883 RepID=UPI000900A497|nr:PREDICTED: F-box protein At5g07610-like [Ipomoea nil]
MDRGQNLASTSNSEDDLNDIIREEVLDFLPAKSLFRFMAVCHLWKRHILTPTFHFNQSLRFTDTTGLFCQTSPETPPVFIPIHPTSAGVPDPSLSFLPEPVVIRASSNGLLCCQGQTEDGHLYLCSPAIKHWKKLPKPTACHGSEPALVVIFEPSRLTNVSEYKLICAFEFPDFGDAIGFEIYSSKTKSWRVSGDFCFGAKKATLRSGVHVNGVVYWPICRRGIVSFDLTKDRSELLDNVNTGSILGTYYGMLCKVVLRLYFTEVVVKVKVNIQSADRVKMWELVRHAVFPPDTYMHMDDDFVCRVVSIGREEVVIQHRNQLYSYDLQTEETKTLTKPDEPEYDICVPYVNNLVYL